MVDPGGIGKNRETNDDNDIGFTDRLISLPLIGNDASIVASPFIFNNL